MRLLWEEEAWEDYCLWQTRDKKLLKRINTLERHPAELLRGHWETRTLKR